MRLIGTSAWEKKDSDGARSRLRQVLTENPANTQAKKLQQTIAAATTPTTGETTLALAYKKPITIEFKDVSLKQVFEVISRSSGLNFLFDKDVRTDQKTSIFLKNSTIESAVHFTLLTNQLEQHVLDANTGLTLRDLRGQNSGTIGAGIGPITVKARQDDSDAKLLANPRIRARNREKAKILIGERVPNITTTATATGFVSESINYVDVGLTLNVEPTIYLDNDVAIKVQLEVSNIVSQIKTQSGTIAYQIGTRTASTVLRLNDGETQVLAGLINDEDRRSGIYDVASSSAAIGLNGVPYRQW